MISMNKAPKLTPEERKMLNKSFYFSLGTNMASSKVSQQSKCFAMAMAPGLEMFYDDPEDRRKAFYRHAGEFFNTHQYSWACWSVFRWQWKSSRLNIRKTILRKPFPR